MDNIETADQIIDAARRLSDSIIWGIQRAYYMDKGPAAWQGEYVPEYITSNPFVARAYGRVVLGYLRDLAAVSGTVNSERPIYIVELAAGSGRFGYHFLTRFFPLLKRSPLAELNVTYVMTDFVPELVKFWQGHERFRPWVEAGMLDFAVFDAMDLRPITLAHAQQTLAPQDVLNPLILIANYFFDSLPQDCFVIKDGQMSENLLTVYGNGEEVVTADPRIWDRVKLVYEAVPLRLPYYEVENYDLILEDYKRVMPDTVLTFPNKALDLLRFWHGYGGGRNLLLTADWGYTLAESLAGQKNPMPNLHGSFSMMVNFDAIKQYYLLENGLVLQPPHYQDSLQVGAYLAGERPQNAIETKLAFSEAVSAGGPDDFYSLKEALEGKYDGMTVAQLLAYLRFSGWDAVVFSDFYTALLAKVVDVSPAWYGDIYQAVENVWQGYLPLKGGTYSEGVFIEGDELERKIIRLLRVMGFEDRIDAFFGEL